METLALFARQPQPSRTKTRLAKSIGEGRALQLYTSFMLDTAHTCWSWLQQTVGADPNRRLVLYTAPDAQDPVLAEVARLAGAHTEVQAEGDLGVRMQACLDDEFARGARSVCILGTDTPHLPLHLLDHAYRALAWHQVVLGPSSDGGYWLVGAQRPPPDLFSNVEYSTPDVTRATIAKCRAQRVEPHLLPMTFDVDDDADLRSLATMLYATGRDSKTWQTLRDLKLVDDDGRLLL